MSAASSQTWRVNFRRNDYYKVHDVDEVAVERACYGDKTVTLNPTETREAFLWLDEHGRTTRQIADTLGVTPRTVERWRAGIMKPRWRYSSTVSAS